MSGHGVPSLARQVARASEIATVLWAVVEAQEHGPSARRIGHHIDACQQVVERCGDRVG